jgi:2-deoxy-D-gluconate 3-dehydrogenase
MEMFSLEGRVAVVTGCSAGLGQALAVGLAGAGAEVAGVSRTAPTETERDVKACGRQFLWIETDLQDPKNIDRVITATIDRFGGLHILVNNAGIIRRAPVLSYGLQDWDEVLNLNLRSVFLLSQAAARQFRRQHSGGKIINIASMLSFQGGITVPAYTASKTAVVGLTRAMANELAVEGIHVNAIAPGYMRTAATEALQNDPEREPAIRSRIPAGRWGEPADLIGAAVFLASRASDYVHGAVLPVDGGWLAR